MNEKRLIFLLFTAVILVCTAIHGPAQTLVSPPTQKVIIRTAAELDQMLGPIALYPDPILAQILPAATLPGEIILANRFVKNGGSVDYIDEQPWDPSIKAVARYLDLLQWLDDNLEWTIAVGQAFLHQPQDVMNCIQRLRRQANVLGNLQTTPFVNVVIYDQVTEILPSGPEYIYIPVYQTDVVYVDRPISEPLVSWKKPLKLGSWLNHDFDWSTRHLMVWRHEHPRPPGWWYCRPNERSCADDGKPVDWHEQRRAKLRREKGLDIAAPKSESGRDIRQPNSNSPGSTSSADSNAGPSNNSPAHSHGSHQENGSRNDHSYSPASHSSGSGSSRSSAAENSSSEKPTRDHTSTQHPNAPGRSR